ncbi:MAG: NAD-dependent epimerase/dehydratase family protein [Thermodesulfobacteriota bacterium]
MKCLVTGVAGFIGSHLAERLLREGYELIGIDSFVDNYPKHIKQNNIKGLLQSSKFKFIEASIGNINLREIVDQVDVVYHQAAIPGVRTSWGQNFEQYTVNNINATQILLEACRYKRIKKFIYASSSSVYGDAIELPIRESSPKSPISPYGVTKLAGENLASLYFKCYGVPTVSLRYFTVYGPRQRPDMAFHRFISAILDEREIEIYGNGEQTRDFTYLDDAVEANVRAFLNGKEGGIYNIGGGSRVKLIESLNIIEEISGKKADLKFIEAQRGDVMHTYADVSTAKRDLGYSPNVDIKEGLRRHYDWLKENVDIYS